jgi:hypothetical protein
MAAMPLNERRVIIAGGVAAGVFVSSKFGLLKLIPSIGPVPAPIATIAVGVLLSAWLAKDGTVGAVIEGVGYGLVAIGVAELGS